MESGQIDISENEIIDRDKSDILSKGPVIAQSGWFILQCIARKVERLSITELGLVTLVFAMLNFVTYGLWWNKPLSVECPYPARRKRKPTLQGNEEGERG